MSAPPIEVKINLPTALEPKDRGELFDLPLCDLFDEVDSGDVVDGGTFVHEGQIVSAVIELEIQDLSLLPRIAEVLAAGGAPSTTRVRIGEPHNREVLLPDLLS